MTRRIAAFFRRSCAWLHFSRFPLAILSLQQKFIVVTSLAILFLAGAIGTLTATKNSAALYTATVKQGQALARTVAALIINELIYEKLGLVEEGGLIDNYIQALYRRRDLDFLSVAMLDNSGRVLSHNVFSEYGKTYQSPFIDRAGQAKEVLVERKKTPDGVDALAIAAPLSIGGKRWGILLFDISLESVKAQTRQMVLQISAVTGGALAIIFVLVYFLSRRFIRPITELAGVMREVDVEMPDRRIHVQGRDELAQLGESFNAMIDRIRQTNAEMKQAHEKLLQSEKMATIGLLASSVAHRINNPLGGIMNCVHMLDKKGADAEARRTYLALIREGAESIEQAVGQLLWTARKRTGEEQRARFGNVLAGVLKFLDYRMKNSGIRFTADFPHDLVLPVFPHDLNQILLNLLVNAIQAMENGGELTLTAQRDSNNFLIRISDSGTGIAEQDMDKLFEPFFTTKETGQGTGLGLWMTYELVKKNGGDIRIESMKGNGATVSITFTG